MYAIINTDINNTSISIAINNNSFNGTTNNNNNNIINDNSYSNNNIASTSIHANIASVNDGQITALALKQIAFVVIKK